MSDLARVFSASGPLAERIDGFVPRPQQRQLSEAIAAALQNDESLLCEAGTGAGKTFAYLAPALLSGKRVIISTGAKHLQEQLYDRDLPLMREALGVPAITAVLKGRANYLCKYRLEQHVGDLFPAAPEEAKQLERIRHWSAQTRRGDLAELTELPEDAAVRTRVVSGADNCLGQECHFYDDCFVFKARREAGKADILVINHHLLLSDLVLRGEGQGEILPRAELIIFDEAHQLPLLASQFFSKTLSSHQCRELLRDTERAYQNDANDMPAARQAIRDCEGGLRRLCQSFGVEERRDAWDDVSADAPIRGALRKFVEDLRALGQCLDKLAERSKALEQCSQRCGVINEDLETFDARESQEEVKWLESDERGFRLYQTPLDVAATFRERLAVHGCNAIYTSATLSVAGDFSHFASQLGLSDVDAQCWASPFDYHQQALLYQPPDLPDPRDRRYTETVAEAALPVIEASRGGAFLLFTSHRALRQTYALLTNGKGSDFVYLCQGQAPRSELLERFRSTPNAVLLGAASFWEGVDVRGAALSCVIIDKLPFMPPDDPVFRARAAKMEAQGQNPFIDYQVPQAVLSLKQGCGRLIRDASDYGVLMICDPRLRRKSYGKVFLESLPDMRRSGDINDVRLFFEERRRGHAS